MDTSSDPSSLLAANPVLRGCATETREMLLRQGQLRQFTPGAVLCADGEPGGRVMFLLDGALQMVNATCRGRRQILCTPHNDTCGGVCFIQFGESVLAEVHALEPGHVLLVERDIFENAAQQDVALNRAAWDGAARCMVHLHTLVATLSFYTVAERVRLLLAEAASTDGGIVHLTQADLAATVGTTREVVARCLAVFQTEGLIRLGRGRITVLDREKLSQ